MYFFILDSSLKLVEARVKITVCLLAESHFFILYEARSRRLLALIHLKDLICTSVCVKKKVEHFNVIPLDIRFFCDKFAS